MQSEQNWKSVTPDKWDKIDSGKWIQKEVWNRMMDRDQSHKTPVTYTWTTDFQKWANIQMVSVVQIPSVYVSSRTVSLLVDDVEKKNG
jgi:hypothetical protein